jgi:ubiquinone/menaquinone biosynthesis C-methylase UbiE
MRTVPLAALCGTFLSLASSARAEGEAERLARLLALAPAASVADIGAGDGSFAVELAAEVGPEGRVYATELEAEKLDAIRARAREAGVANVLVRGAKVDATNLPEACCDAIVMRHVYHHLTEPAAVNRDVLRALAPGGRFVVVDFPPTWYLRLFTPEGVGEERSRHGIAVADALAELRAAGFEPVEVIEAFRASWIGPDSYALVLRRASATPAP